MLVRLALPAHLRRQLERKTKPGDKVTFTVIRGSQERTVTVTLASAPQ